MRFAVLFVLSTIAAACSSGNDAFTPAEEDGATHEDASADATDDDAQPGDSATPSDGAMSDSATSDGAIDSGTPAVRLVGRFTDKNEFEWSSSHLIARFEGTGAHLKLNAN